MMLPREEILRGESRVARILGGTIFPQILTTFFVLGRIISRVWVVGKWAWDDTLIVLAWISSLVLTVLLDVGTIFGQGHHIENAPFSLIIQSFKVAYGSIIAYQLCLLFTKISILVFYLRVFPARREKWMTWGTIVAVFLFSAPLLAADIFQCNPITNGAFITDKVMCFDAAPVLKASAILHTITDAWMIIMVIPVVMALDIPKRRKYTLMGILGLGVFVIIASIARITSILRDQTNRDITWIIAEFDIWSVLECGIGIICACAPTVRPLLHKLFPKFMASRSGSGHATYGKTKRESVIGLGSRNLQNNISAPMPMDKKTTWMSNPSEDNLTLKPNVVVRPEEYARGYPRSPLQRNASTGPGGRASMAARRERDSLYGC